MKLMSQEVELWYIYPSIRKEMSNIMINKYGLKQNDVAKKLNIQHKHIKLDKKFPMIKCNVNKRGKKLFFLPFDKYYDQVHIEKDKGEFYTNSINECIKKGLKHVGKN